MPQFMDFHEELTLPFEVIQQITQEANDGVTDEFGVRQVELYYTTESGQVYCLLEAPDAEAVRKHPAAIGVPCGDVHQVTGIR